MNSIQGLVVLLILLSTACKKSSLSTQSPPADEVPSNNQIPPVVQVPGAVSISAPAAISIAEPEAGSGVNVLLPLTLSRASTEPVTINFVTVPSTAQASTDFTEVSGTLTFAPGEINKNISVPLTGNDLLGADKQFRIDMTSPVEAILSVSSSTVTIVDNELTVSVSANPAGVVEGGTLPFTITLSRPAPVAIDVAYFMGGAAKEGVDYSGTTGTVRFEPGQTSNIVTLTIADDAIAEVAESVVLSLWKGTGYIISANAVAISQIQRSDMTPSSTGAGFRWVNAAFVGSVDPDGAGPVTSLYTVDGGSTSRAFTTIAGAIAASNPDEVIVLAAGTYTENVAIPSSLLIVGPNEGVNPNTSARSPEARIVGNVTATGNTETSFSGIEVAPTAGTTAIRKELTTAGTPRLAVSNVVVTLPPTNTGIFLTLDSAAAVSSSSISETKISGLSGSSTGINVQHDSSLTDFVAITDTEIFGLGIEGAPTSSRGIQFDAAANIIVAKSKVSNVTAHGLQFAGIGVPTCNKCMVSQNTFLNNALGTDTTDRGGIRLYADRVTNAVVVGNTFTGGKRSISIRDGNGSFSLTTKLTANFNSFLTADLVGFHNVGLPSNPTGLWDLRYNYWGVPAGPEVGTQITGAGQAVGLDIQSPLTAAP